MEINKAILDELQSIGEKMTAIENRVIAIDTSVIGDEKRGVVGIKQHLSKFDNTLTRHTEDDERQFTDISDTINRVKYWLAGAAFVVSTVVSTVVVVVKIYK